MNAVRSCAAPVPAGGHRKNHPEPRCAVQQGLIIPDAPVWLVLRPLSAAPSRQTETEIITGGEGGTRHLLRAASDRVACALFFFFFCTALQPLPPSSAACCFLVEGG